MHGVTVVYIPLKQINKSSFLKIMTLKVWHFFSLQLCLEKLTVL